MPTEEDPNTSSAPSRKERIVHGVLLAFLGACAGFGLSVFYNVSHDYSVSAGACGEAVESIRDNLPNVIRGMQEAQGRGVALDRDSDTWLAFRSARNDVSKACPVANEEYLPRSEVVTFFDYYKELENRTTIYTDKGGDWTTVRDPGLVRLDLEPILLEWMDTCSAVQDERTSAQIWRTLTRSLKSWASE
ncbi:hypothetical protein [Rhodococcus qingshengii]|uniref:hypothetical protein n=1 Tax=Rhodococcus qingshengii TaxID=334542 RepID=UPI001ADEF248|nr:hypothetical protein [Rhodococcus qingshengii]MCQ4148694.1 hypothetical protein [Rhodococcus qingshengii]